MIYRLKSNHPDADQRHANVKAGMLAFESVHNKDILTLDGSGYGYQFKAADVELEKSPKIDATDFSQLIDFILSGRVLLPNFEPLSIAAGMNMIAQGNTPEIRRGNVLLPGAQRATWARAFLHSTQGGQLDGSGFVVWYRMGQQTEPPESQFGRFAICKHQFVAGRGGNPSRGWNPGHCGLCRLDMSVDSSD